VTSFMIEIAWRRTRKFYHLQFLWTELQSNWILGLFDSIMTLLIH
jgi:hypothetical protein